LQQADLSKVVEIDFHATAPWKTKGRSAWEVVAALALDTHQPDDTHTLACDVLATDNALLGLWELGDEYTPVVYELLLALDKRLMLVPTTPGRHEWRIVD